MDIKEIILSGDATAVTDAFMNAKKPFYKSFDAVMSEYDQNRHKVFDRRYRKDKYISVPIEGKYDREGNQMTKRKRVERNRVAIPFQKILVERSVGFLLGVPVEYKTSNTPKGEAGNELFSDFESVMADNKMEYMDKKIARTLFSERECAEIWYFSLDKDGRPSDMRMRIVSPSKGDALYPHFDEYDRMDSFARRYSVTEADGAITTHFDVYTDELVYNYSDAGGKMALDGNPKRHGFTKIPVVYYRQEQTEWENVQTIIERVEDLVSNWGDTNDYFGSPSYFVSGNISGFADKGEQGRVYTGEGGADMKVLSWDSSPQSINNELAMLTNFIFSYTQTPDVSFETMKQLGNNTSGAAIKLMFTDPHMKANLKIEDFGELFSRRANIVKNGIVTTMKPYADGVEDDVYIIPVFTPYIPKNDSETISNIKACVGDSPIMSQEEAVRLNPLVRDPEQTIKSLEEVKEKEAEANLKYEEQLAKLKDKYAVK